MVAKAGFWQDGLRLFKLGMPVHVVHPYSIQVIGGDQLPQLVEYLKEPPTAKTLDAILDMLGMEPRDLMRKKEKEYKEAGLDDDSLTRKQLIDAMVKYPRLIERPIVIKGNKAALGRPPEKVLDIL